MRGLYPSEFALDHITRHTHGLADIVASTDPETSVATCGDWTMADLAFHLYEVQHFWVHIIGNRPQGPEVYDRPERPAAGLETALRATCDRLVSLLADADPAEEAWSWAPDSTVGFTVRRQIHESMIHHVDGVLAVDGELPEVSPRLAADGVDELVDVMLTGVPGWATFVPTIQVVQVQTTDTDDQWTMSLGTVSGTSDQTGMSYDGLPAAVRVADDRVEEMRPDLTVRGGAFDLLLWMWGRRGLEGLTLDGDQTMAEDLRLRVVTATQ